MLKWLVIDVHTSSDSEGQSFIYISKKLTQIKIDGKCWVPTPVIGYCHRLLSQWQMLQYFSVVRFIQVSGNLLRGSERIL